MEKYTVDLDKLLNDFEFSEYSLESAKTNKVSQDEMQNQSLGTNICKKNTSNVKHSMNNVFFSLNEYLSSDMKPKENEIIHARVPKDYENKDPLQSVKKTFEVSSEKSNISHEEPETIASRNQEKELEETEYISDVNNINKTENLIISHKNSEIVPNIVSVIEVSDNVIEFDKKDEVLVQEETLVDIENGEPSSNVKDSIDQDDNTVPSGHIYSDEFVKNDPNIETKIKIGFDNEINIDEDNLDQYFEELEQELGDDTQMVIKNDSDKITDIVQLTEQQEDDIQPEHKDENKVQEEPPSETGIDRNSRPNQLNLTEETADTVRKINLVGNPGSTPYNNVYSAQCEFDESANTSSVRPTSPTYSDISTNSISSVSSGESAVLRKENEVQNNHVPGKSSCKDMTIEKDFENDLKTNAVKEEQTISKVAGNEQAVSNGGQVIEETKEEQQNECSTNIEWLGKQAPLWIPDNEAIACLHCDTKFTVIKRRHHCRACGLVLCSKCCNLKHRLEYLDGEARVCKKCHDVLAKDANESLGTEVLENIASSPAQHLPTTSGQCSNSLGQPNPNNPLEYCSMIPPLQQIDPGAVTPTPSVMVPVGVLKRKGSSKNKSSKSVMFCDGIRPGSDLTDLDKDFGLSDRQKLDKSKRSSKKNLQMLDPESKSFIPTNEKDLPPVVTIFKSDVKYSACTNDATLVETLKTESLTFALQSNVFVHLKIVNMDCCVNRSVWCFSTEGLMNVGQDEIVILLESYDDEPAVPKDIFCHINSIYLEALKGSSIKELGLSLHQSTIFLGSKNHAGFLFIRPTFQCMQNLIIPKEPYIVGILIHRWETPWAKLFPLRLILRLGAEYKYYPSPIISTRERDSVFVEIGHTIINLLADFRNFSYTLPQIRGLTIHMEDKNTTVTIPVNRFDQVLKGLSNSSDHILAFAGNFSTVADSHLVCIQDTQGPSNAYTTHAINICNQPRKVTGASFIVFNGALKSSSGLTAKSNIVEDGLMIQILPEHMTQVRESLKNMKDHTIKCGCINDVSDETVTIVWGEPDTGFNVGVVSPIDSKSMIGIPSIRVHNGKDYACTNGTRLIRWTEVFIIQSGEETLPKNQEPVDISKLSESIAKATCHALFKYLDLLVSNSFYKIALRTNLHVENVSYVAGSNNLKLPPIYMKSLDNELIPVLHKISSNDISTEQPIILELIFRILNI